MPDPALLLDTHVWVWLVEGRSEMFGGATANKLKAASREGRLLVSPISVWELGVLESKGRIRLEPEVYQWVADALAAPGVRVAEITPEIALDTSRLAGRPPADPADRMLIATARRMRAILVTADKQILAYLRRDSNAAGLAAR